MKKANLLALIPGFLMMACMDTTELDNASTNASKSITAEGAAKTNLYLADVADSAVTPVSTTASDDSVKEDTKAARLKAMADKLLDRLDADDSGSLSESEFLGLAKPLDPEKAASQSAEDLAAKEAKLKEQFAKAAGDDAILSAEEIQSVLQSNGGRVGKFRHAKHNGQNATRVKEMTAEVLAKFDTNGDGKLDETEAAALRASDKAACKGKKGSEESEAGTEAPVVTPAATPVAALK